MDALIAASAGGVEVLKTLTAADVKGRIGPGASEGLLAVFERPV